jgi:hypothetical protein
MSVHVDPHKVGVAPLQPHTPLLQVCPPMHIDEDAS